MTSTKAVTSTTSTTTTSTNTIIGYYSQLAGTDLTYITDATSNNIYNVYLYVQNLSLGSTYLNNNSVFRSLAYYTVGTTKYYLDTSGFYFLCNRYASSISGLLPFAGEYSTFSFPLLSVPNTVTTSNIYVGFTALTASSATISTSSTSKEVTTALSTFTVLTPNIFTTQTASYTQQLPVVTISGITSSGYLNTKTFNLVPNGSRTSLSASGILYITQADMNSYGNNYNNATFTGSVSTTTAVFIGTFNGPKLTVTSASSTSGFIYVGMTVTGGSGSNSLSNGAYISDVSGTTFGIGTYSLARNSGNSSGPTLITGTGYVLNVSSVSNGLITIGMLLTSNGNVTQYSSIAQDISGNGGVGTYSLLGNTLTCTNNTITGTGSVITGVFSNFYKSYRSSATLTGNTRTIYTQNVGSIGNDTFTPGCYVAKSPVTTNINTSDISGNGATYYTDISGTPYLLIYNKLQNYAKPGLNYFTTNAQSSTTNTLYVAPTITQKSTNHVSITSVSVPPHPIGNYNGNITTANSASFYISSNPQYISQYGTYVDPSGNPQANGVNGNNIATLPGTVGWTVDNCGIYACLDANYQNPMMKEILDVFGGHPNVDNNYHHHAIYPALYNWVVDYNPRLAGFMADGYPIVTPFLVSDATTGSTRLIRSSDLNSNNGLVANVSFNFKWQNATTQSYVFSFCYVATNCFPYTIGSFYGRPVIYNTSGVGKMYYT